MLISVIIPIRNEEKFISKTLSSIINQKFDGELEIIIADGCSIDGTLDKVKQFQNQYKNIKLIRNNGQIVPTGFNKALNISKGDIIIRVDGHSTLEPDFIENSIRVLDETNAFCVGGPTKHFSNTIIGNNISIAQSSIFGAGGASFRTGVKKGKYVNTLAFGAYKRSVFFNNGAYDEELIRNQDEEFNFRLIKQGKKIWIDPTIKSTYFVRDSLVKLFKQYYQYGFFKVRVIQKVKALISWRHLVPACFVFIIIFLTFLGISINNFLPLKIFFGLYFIINFTFTIYESLNRKSRLLIFLPLVYFIMHLSYGIGFIAGLCYFLNKWGNNELVDSHFDKQKFLENSNV